MAALITGEWRADVYDMDFSTSGMLSGLIIGSVGLFFFLYGKRAGKPIQLVMGLAMCVYPYFITNLVLLWLVTGALAVPLWMFRHR